MTRLRQFAKHHRLALETAGVLLALVLFGLAVGAIAFAVMESYGLAEWAALVWALMTL